MLSLGLLPLGNTFHFVLKVDLCVYRCFTFITRNINSGRGDSVQIGITGIFMWTFLRYLYREGHLPK